MSSAEWQPFCNGLSVLTSSSFLISIEILYVISYYPFCFNSLTLEKCEIFTFILVIGALSISVEIALRLMSQDPFDDSLTFVQGSAACRQQAGTHDD